MNVRSALVGTGALLWVAVFAVTAAAHEVTYQGTVLAVESARIHVRTIDLKTRKEEDLWFLIDKTTKAKRGDKSVSVADARISKGERIVVIVEHDAEPKLLAKEIRLAGR